MGCVASRIEMEERVQTCKSRKRLVKQLVAFRGEFADAQLDYLRALKNTGVTLRQFTESDSLELESTNVSLKLPPSLPPPLPPSPPPPPPFSPDLRKSNVRLEEELVDQESIEIGEDDMCWPPPPPVPSSAWDFLDPFDSSFPCQHKKNEPVDQVEEEEWAEANTEFQEGDEEQVEEIISDVVAKPLFEMSHDVELLDDESSMLSWHTKDTADMAVVLWKGKKTLAGIVKELDDYFLKASAGGKELAVLMDIKRRDTLLPQNFKENTSKKSNSAKVFSALSWSWSSRSLQVPRDILESCDQREPCRPGAHCVTLERLYVAEQKLYKEVKEEEIIKVEYERKSQLLQKLQQEDLDSEKSEKTQIHVESLQIDLSCLQQSISRSCSSILKLIDEELHPQLVVLTSGLKYMWRTMYECHQVQNHISQQINHLTNAVSTEPTTDYHRRAAAQLETEVTAWYNSFIQLTKSQRNFVRTLCRWIDLTDCLLVDGDHHSLHSSGVHTVCQEWQLALDRLPDKIVSEAIKSFCSSIHSIIEQQSEEHKQQKKSAKLEKRLQKELYSLAEMEKKYEASFITGEARDLSNKHPLHVKRTKTEAYKKRVEAEKIKYQNSVQVSKAMILSNLKTCLPNVFQALMGFSSDCSRAFEALHDRVRPTVSCDSS